MRKAFIGGPCRPSDYVTTAMWARSSATKTRETACGSERVTTIVEFLETRFREDEHGATHSGNLPVPAKNYHQRTLREVAAKRRIVSRYRDAPVSDVVLLLNDVRDLASVYADHPDYDQAWRPMMDPAVTDLSESGVLAGQRGQPFPRS